MLDNQKFPVSSFTQPVRCRSETSLTAVQGYKTPLVSIKAQPESLTRSQSDGQLYLRRTAAVTEVAHHIVGVSGVEANGPSYENYFVSDKNDFDALAQQCLFQGQESKQGYFAVIQKPDDLQQDGLAKDVVITPEGGFESREGLLFGKEPVTLLIDFRKFPPDLLPELNELFEKPARFQGRVLGSHVRIISVLAQHMLPDGKNQGNAPGPDFWWRMNNTCPPQTAQECISLQRHVSLQSLSQHGLSPHSFSPQEWIEKTVTHFEKTTDSQQSSDQIKVIDFTGRDWRNLLVGTPDVDENGHLIYRHGALKGLQAGQHIVFKNAPWDDMAFALRVFDIFSKSQFRCNGEVVSLPKPLKLSQQTLSLDEMQEAANSLKWLTPEGGDEKPQRVACINEDTFPQLMQETILTEEGVIRRSDSLANWLQKADCIRISSPLTESQWLQFIKRLQAAQLQHLPIIIDRRGKQPDFIKHAAPVLDNSALLQAFTESGVQIKLCETSNTQLPLTPPYGDESAEEFVILPEQSLTKVSRNTRIQSLQERRFHCQVTRLIQLFREGKPVCLTGLQSNPVLLRQFESLLCNPPHLMIYGVCEEFPKLQLTISWPKGLPMPSPIWQSCLDVTPVQAERIDDKENYPENSVQAFGFKNLQRLYIEMASLQAATYCPEAPPADIHKVFIKVLTQAECERVFDGSTELQPYHIYKSISSVVLKEYRRNTEVYCYLKNLCSRLFKTEEYSEYSGQLWIDKGYLLDWLESHPVIDKELVKKHFWHLARAFPASTFCCSQSPEKDDIAVMTAHLVALACKDENDSGALQLRQELAQVELSAVSVARKTQKECVNRSLRREKQFYHLLAVLHHEQRQSGSIHQQAQILAKAAARGTAELEQAVKTVITPAAQNDDVLLARLLKSSPDWQSWETCRIQRLAAKVHKHPVVFIKGETGAGKSYIAEAVARELNPDMAPVVITVGPETEVSDLLGRMALDKTGDSQALSSNAPLREWAERRSDKEIVIIIDEANLATPELWNCLKGLYEDSPCIYCHGEKIYLTSQHRIIMTGNPDHFSGRRMNELLRIHAPQLYYPLLKPAFIEEKVLRHGLTDMLASVLHLDEADRAKAQDLLIQSITQLYGIYPSLLPDRVFTPRDLTDIISRIQMYLSAHNELITLTEEGVNGLVWQVMDDALGGEVTEERKANKIALKNWYEGRRQVDDSLTLPHQKAFECFYQHWLAEQGGCEKAAVRLDCSNDSVRALMRRIWQEQQRSLQECAVNVPHRGRHATIIFGPAGRGKSALLGQQLCFMCQQKGLPAPRQINAGKHSWELLRQAVMEAKQEGRVLIISEPNLLKSEELEGLLNNITTGQATPGFHVYATANESDFVGRHWFSPALKNRFTCISITDYTDKDIRQIAGTVFGGLLTELQTDKIVEWHLRLLQYLKVNRIPLKPLIGDLQKLAQELRHQKVSSHSSEALLEQAFRKQYGIYLTVGQCSLDSLPPLQRETSEVGEKQLADLSRALNRASYKASPVVLEASTQSDKIHASSSCSVAVPQALLASKQPQDTAVKTQTTLTVALAKWKEKSGTDECPYEHDTLYSACYKLWQQNYLQKELSLSPDVLPLSQEQRETLGHPDNQALYRQIEKLIQQEPSPRGLELLWENLSPLAQKPTAYQDSVNKVDGKTSFREQSYKLERIFNSVKPRNQRLKVTELLVDGDNLVVASVVPGQSGFDVICPSLLKAPVHLMGDEHYGVCVKTLDTKNYVSLAGVYPHQTITQFCAEPEIPLECFDIVRDRRTGQMMVRLRPLSSNQNSMKIKLHYVLKKVSVSQYQSVTKTLPDMSSPFTPIVRKVLDSSDLAQQNPLDFIAALTTWGQAFQSGPDIAADNDIEMLRGIVEHQHGSCRHRSWAAYAVAAAKNISVRLISSDSHEWIEVSSDEGRTWHAIDLGGTSGHKVSVYSYTAKEFARGLIPSKDEREKLLAEAIQDTAAFALKTGVTQEEVEAWIANDGATPLPATNLSTVHWSMLNSGKLHEFSVALTMLKSGACILEHDESNQLLYICGLASAFSKVFFQCETPQDREAACELLYSVKHLFHNTNETSQEEYWQFLTKRINDSLHAICTEQVSAGEALPHSSFMPEVFEFLSYCILKKDLLDQLPDYMCQWSYGQLRLGNENVVPEQYRKTFQQLKEKFDEHYKHYFPSIEARAAQTPSAQISQPLPQETLLSGYSPTLESKLRTTHIGTGYTWQPEGELVVSHLLRQQPPFREQKAVAAIKQVKLIQTHAPALLTNDNKLVWFRLIYGERFSSASNSRDLIPEEIWRQVDLKVSSNLTVYLDYFLFDPTHEFANKIFKVLEGENISVPDSLRKELQARIDNRKVVDDILATIPQSFAHYFTKVVNASAGNLWLYHICQDDKYRGFSKPANAEALLQADRSVEEFLPMPPSIVQDHIQKVDKSSLIITLNELDTYLQEFFVELQCGEV